MKNWEYAELSTAAKAVGGPEKYKELLMAEGIEEGMIEGRKELASEIVLAAVGAGCIVCGILVMRIVIPKIVSYIKAKKESAQHEKELILEVLIDSIRKTDSAHTDDNETQL